MLAAARGCYTCLPEQVRWCTRAVHRHEGSYTSLHAELQSAQVAINNVQMGKELTAAAKAEDDQKLKRAADVRRREKEELEAARAKIQVKLDEDRCAHSSNTKPRAPPRSMAATLCSRGSAHAGVWPADRARAQDRCCADSRAWPGRRTCPLCNMQRLNIAKHEKQAMVL